MQLNKYYEGPNFIRPLLAIWITFLSLQLVLWLSGWWYMVMAVWTFGLMSLWLISMGVGLLFYRDFHKGKRYTFPDGLGQPQKDWVLLYRRHVRRLLLVGLAGMGLYTAFGISQDWGFSVLIFAEGLLTGMVFALPFLGDVLKGKPFILTRENVDQVSKEIDRFLASPWTRWVEEFNDNGDGYFDDPLGNLPYSLRNSAMPPYRPFDSSCHNDDD